MEKLLEKLNNKKMIENAVIFLILAIIVMIVINSIFSTEDNSKSNETNITNEVLEQTNSKSLNVGKNELSKELEEILSLISGAGKVSVMISYKNDTEKIPMIDTKVTTTIVSEKDSGGGERKTEETNTEESVVFEENGSSKNPVIKHEINPQVVGVVVVAEGASNNVVKENLIKAVEAAIDVPSHRIQVFARKS